MAVRSHGSPARHPDQPGTESIREFLNRSREVVRRLKVVDDPGLEAAELLAAVRIIIHGGVGTPLTELTWEVMREVGRGREENGGVDGRG